MKKRKEVHPAEVLANRLKHLFVLGKLFEPLQNYRCIDDLTIKNLSSDGQGAVRKAVQYCLENNVTPDCSVRGDDGGSDGDIRGLNQVNYLDLLAKLELIRLLANLNFISKAPKLL